MTGPLSPKKTAGYVQVPRELLLDAGVVEPTPDERAEAERRHAEYRGLFAEYEAARNDFRRRVAAITEQPARAVLDLHKDDGHGCCGGCEFSGYEAEPPDWPCSTVDTIARHYGINPEDLP